MSRVEFDKRRLKIVPIEAVTENTWNPKTKDTPEFTRVLRSVERHGLRLPVVVRQLGDGYEVIDGAQRLEAARRLGMKKILVYDEGEVPDGLARELTLWYQQQVPFDDLLLAELVTTMLGEYDDVEVPYDGDEVEAFQRLLEFEWSDYGPSDYGPLGHAEEGPSGPEGRGVEFVCMMSEQEYETVIRAIEATRGDSRMSDGEALAAICGRALEEAMP